MERFTKKDNNGSYYIESKNGLLESNIKGYIYGEAINRFAELENTPTGRCFEEKIIKLAEKNNVDGVYDHTIEELAELIQALIKDINTANEQYNAFGNIDNIVEEIADVEIMLEQLKYTLQKRVLPDIVNDINGKKEEKIERQLSRFGLND